MGNGMPRINIAPALFKEKNYGTERFFREVISFLGVYEPSGRTGCAT